MHRVPEDPSVRGARWPELWPARLGKAPYWLDRSQTGVYGKPAPEDFAADLAHWRKVVRSSYLAGMGITGRPSGTSWTCGPSTAGSPPRCGR